MLLENHNIWNKVDVYFSWFNYIDVNKGVLHVCMFDSTHYSCVNPSAKKKVKQAIPAALITGFTQV